MRSVLFPLISLIAFFPSSVSTVHRIKMFQHKQSAEAYKVKNQISNERRERLLDFHGQFEKRNVGNLYKSNRYLTPLTTSIDISEHDGLWYKSLAGEITVGTPGQSLLVEFDLYYHSDLLLINYNATIDHWGHDPDANETLYHPEKSGTYIDNGCNFTLINGDDGGHMAHDILNIGTISTNIAIGVLDRTRTDNGAAGIVGLSHSYSSMRKCNTTSNLMTQLSSQLDQPILSYTQSWVITSHQNATGHITLGALDSTNCHKNWTWAPNINIMFGGYGVNASRISALTSNGSVISTAAVITRVYIDQSWTSIYTTERVFSMFVNASKAVWNGTIWEYVVDCDSVPNLGNVVFAVGDNKHAIVITPAEYIFKGYYGCILDVVGSGKGFGGVDFINLNNAFFYNHCVAYNYETDKVGISRTMKNPDGLSDSQDSYEYSYD